MYCNKCGNEVSIGQQYCNKCGNKLEYNIQKETINNYNKTSNNEKKKILLIAITTIIIIGVISFSAITLLGEEDYNFYHEKMEESGQQENNNTSGTKQGRYKTAIIADNIYEGMAIRNEKDANNLIKKDSVDQKKSDYPKEIIKIENDIIEKYSITAVNLKEMDVDFAKELESVIKNIYDNYPNARGYLTNLTLTNLDMSNSNVIALFMPSFMFASSNTETTKPWVIKTQIQLNARYFLNPKLLTKATAASSKAGHFPPNATKYSAVAHELGHYLSFIALLNHYDTESFLLVEDNTDRNFYNIIRDFGMGDFSKQMLDEAYQNYINDKGMINFDEWRGKISNYALAKDDSGEYIYDETVAEAFHDVYLNGDNAAEPSKYIVKILKKYINE